MTTPAQLADPRYWLEFSRARFSAAETMDDLEAAGRAMIAFAWVVEPDVAAVDFDLVAEGLEACYSMVSGTLDKLARQRDNVGCVGLRSLLDRIEDGVAVLSLYGCESPHIDRLCWRIAMRNRRQGVKPDASDWIVPDAGDDATGSLGGIVTVTDEHGHSRTVEFTGDEPPPRAA
ncbi:MAG: hypothetical protein ACLQJR_34595 [Stellaceae bacterium]